METKVILLVEDNPDDEFLTLRSLESNHIANEVVVVRDGQAALDWLYGRGGDGGRSAADLPAMILLDLKMPKISGLDLLQRLRAEPRTRRIPVVIFTSSGEERDVLQSYEFGANSYVRKPVEFSEFSEAVRQLGLYWLVINAPPPR
ncbi:MAG: response regulator [Planctomycetota bacterium]